ncbi:MAG TPA: ATPase domain-containing protein [Candidatus Bathyarchaeia archaeon]|nr:ATPase domain-containing protein [Candidatus Bathyarchaeia archaeon]
MEPTGIKVLDDLLGGGFPRPSAVGITGPVGSGKSTLVKQIAAAALERDFRVQYYAVDESAEDVKASIANYGADVDKYEAEGRLSFVDMFALGVERLAESFPMDQPEQIVDATMRFSDLIAQGRSFTLKHLGKKTMGIMDSLTPFFLMVEAKKVFQYGQVLKYATRFAKSIGIATLHTHVLEETIENAMVNFADIVLDMEKWKGEGSSRGGTLRLVKMGKTFVPSRGYYYDMTQNGINISTAPMI